MRIREGRALAVAMRGVVLSALFISASCATAGGACAVVSTLVSNIDASGDVSVGPTGDIYVADFGARLGPAGGQQVYKVSRDGVVAIFSRGFDGASGNEFGRDGNLYQSDIGRGEVYRIASDGSRIRLASGLHSPVGVTTGRNGEVYVTQCDNRTVSRITSSGFATVATGAPLNCPNGLTLGPDGNLYTTNFFDGAVIQIQLASGRMSVLAQIPGGGNGHIAYSNGRFYVASFRGNRIYAVTMSGTVCPVAGSGVAGNADGDAGNATMFHPNGVALSADGDTLYFNATTRIGEPGDPSLHPNAIRRVIGLHTLPSCGGQP